MMTELLLIGLGIYLLTKGVNKARILPELDTAVPGFPGGAPRDQVCPWFWKNRPAIFNTVPLNPGSRGRWLKLCELWREIAQLGNKVDLLEAQVMKIKDPQDIQNMIKGYKDRIAFLMKETKRIANIQREFEAKYYQGLKTRFSDQEIQSFYEDRKNEIVDRIWPKQETQVVPILSPGNSTAIDPGVKITFDPGMGGYNKKKGVIERIPNTIDVDRDSQRQAKPPGKRFTDGGGVYYEYRQNRSDYKGSI